MGGKSREEVLSTTRHASLFEKPQSTYDVKLLTFQQSDISSYLLQGIYEIYIRSTTLFRYEITSLVMDTKDFI